jgi:hypothetical protein
MTMFMKDIANTFILNCEDIRDIRNRIRVTTYDERGKLSVKAHRNGQWELLYSMTEEDYLNQSNHWIAQTNLRRNTEIRLFWLINSMLDQGIKI